MYLLYWKVGEETANLGIFKGKMILWLSTMHFLSSKLMVLQFLLLVALGSVSFFLINFPSMSPFMSWCSFTHKHRNRKQCGHFPSCSLQNRKLLSPNYFNYLVVCKQCSRICVPSFSFLSSCQVKVWAWYLSKFWIRVLYYMLSLQSKCFGRWIKIIYTLSSSQ